MTAKDDAQAVIKDGCIVIRVRIANLQAIMDGGYACNAYTTRWKVTDTVGFAKEISSELNDEDEEGTTMIHRMFDRAILQAIERGAQHVDEHETQEF